MTLREARDTTISTKANIPTKAAAKLKNIRAGSTIRGDTIAAILTRAAWSSVTRSIRDYIGKSLLVIELGLAAAVNTLLGVFTNT